MKSFFSRYFTAHLLILLSSLILVSLFSIFSMKQFLYTDNQERQLEFTHTLASMVEFSNVTSETGNDFLNNIKKDPNLRITLISIDGQVVGDTVSDSRLMDNHGTRPEVIQALAMGEGQSKRLSSTLRESLLYTAVYLESQEMVVRVSMVVGNIERMVVKLALRVSLIAFLVLLLSLVLSFTQTSNINRMLYSIVSVVKDYARGDFQQNLYIGGFKEAEEVGNAVNSMGRQLQDKIETITLQRNKSDAMFDNMVEPVIYVDNNLVIIDTNRAAQTMVDRSFAKCFGKNILQVIKNLELSNLAEGCLREGIPQKRVITHNNHYYRVQGSPISRGEHQDQHILLVMNDITDIKQIELMRKDFVANVSHELRTPITSILGFIETLQMMGDQKSEQREKFLAIIQKQSKRLQEIINDLLTLATLEEDKGIFKREIVLFKDLVDEAMGVCSAKAEEQNITFLCEYDETLEVHCHKNLAEQALVNYMDNAIKYGPQKSEIIIRAERSGDSFKVSVIDQGEGIPQEHRERLFERFYRIDKDRNREKGGTGLGLSIVKHIALKHGGTVGISSEERNRTCFYFTFSHQNF